MIKHIVSLATAILIMANSAVSASSLYSEAMNLYGQKKYADAADLFVKVIKFEPTNASANYYAGYCYYLSGQKEVGLGVFWFCANTFAKQKEGFLAREFLKKFDPLYLKHSTDASVAKLPQVKEEQTLTSSQKKPEQTSATTAISLIKVLRSQSDRPNVTESFRDKIVYSVSKLPRGVLTFLEQHQCKIYLTSSVVEKDFRMQNIHLGGYAEGSTERDCPALFDGKDVIIGEYTDSPNGYTEVVGLDGAVRHEVGHALDHYLGDVSQSEPFKHAYEWDFPGSSRLKPELAYYVRGGPGGQAETFAELCCYKFGGETEEFHQTGCELLHRLYTRCDAIVESCLNKLK